METQGLVWQTLDINRFKNVSNCQYCDVFCDHLWNKSQGSEICNGGKAVHGTKQLFCNKLHFGLKCLIRGDSRNWLVWLTFHDVTYVKCE